MTQPHTQDVAEIAGKLSMAQRRAVIEAKVTIGGDWRVGPLYRSRVRVSAPTLRRLEDFGLTSPRWPPCLTALGLQVRAYLLSQSDGGERG